MEAAFTNMLSYVSNASDIVVVDTHQRSQIQKQSSTDTPPITLLDKLNNLWSQFFPNVTIWSDPLSQSVYVADKNQNHRRSVNSMSTGERAVLYFLCLSVIVPDGSIIIVDEPETNLNPALYKQLWKLITEYRSDCHFIFISHSQEFIDSQSSAELLWLHDSDASKNEYNLEPATDTGLPKTLLAQLVVSQKPVLFCEGKPDSDDYNVYSSLYGKNYLVVPIGDHNDVIRYTKAVNKVKDSRLFKFSALGLIDGDSLINFTPDAGIYVLPYNEIEMLLVDPEVQKSVYVGTQASKDDKDLLENLVTTANRSIIQKVKDNKALIVNTAIKDNLDAHSATRRVVPKQMADSEFKFEDSIKATQENLINSAKEYRQKTTEYLDQAIQSEDIMKVLKVCNLKHQISGQLMQTMAKGNYVSFAETQIADNEDLQKYLREYIGLPAQN